jgi:hypothetical protein
MIRNSKAGAPRGRRELPLLLACVLAVGLAPTGAQEPPRTAPAAPAVAPPLATAPPPVAVPAPAPPPQVPAGPLGTIGRILDESLLGVGIRGAREQVDNLTGRAGEAAKGAAGAVGRLRRPGVVAGRELCPKAPNGAPDCVTATLVMCRANGFETGSSIDMQTEENCPTATPAGPMSPPPDESECRLESYVMRALCR